MFTLPNLVSLARIALIPVFVWLAVSREDYVAAGLLLGLIGSTDWVDGYLARRLDQVSAFGKVLDPLADRLAVAAAVIVGWVTGVLPWVIAVLIVLREAVVALAALVLAAVARRRVEVRRMGKVATFGLYFAIPSFFMYAGTDLAFWQIAGWGLAVPSLVLYYLVALRYLGDMWDSFRPVSSPPVADPGDTG